MAEQRQRVVTELVNTERDFCNDLELCVKYFLLELRTAQVGFSVSDRSEFSRVALGP